MLDLVQLKLGNFKDPKSGIGPTVAVKLGNLGSLGVLLGSNKLNLIQLKLGNFRCQSWI